MECTKCKGKVFIDRVYSDNKDFETYCILCGDRRFVDKNTEVGQWLGRMEAKRRLASGLAN